MGEGNEPQSGERIFRRSAAYALLQTRPHGLQPWLHSNAAPRLFGLNRISSEYSFFRADAKQWLSPAQLFSKFFKSCSVMNAKETPCTRPQKKWFKLGSVHSTGQM